MLHFLWDKQKQLKPVLSLCRMRTVLWLNWLPGSSPFFSVVDETRVKLNDEENDYINANYVKVNPLDTHTHARTHTRTHTQTHKHTHTHTHTHTAHNRASFPGSPLHHSQYKWVRLLSCSEWWAGCERLWMRLHPIHTHIQHMHNTYVAVPCRNRRLFHRVFRSHCCLRSAVSLNFR